MRIKKNISKFIIKEDKKIDKAIENLNNLNPPILFVINKFNKFIGTLTDGDIRRHLLNKKKLNEKVVIAANKKPITCKFKDIKKNQYYKKILYKYNLKGIPILKNNKIFSAFLALDDELNKTPIMIMAGGKGKRLLPFTKNLPKPLLQINGKPIINYIIDNIIKEKFLNVYVSVNYKKGKIVKYFKINKNFGLNIKLINERSPLGTAGALYYLKNINEDNLILINGDIITDLKLEKILSFHEQNKNLITVGCRNYQVQIPFGVIRSNKGKFKKIDEKPKYNNLINSGIYVISKSIILKLLKPKKLSMIDLIEKTKKNRIGVFPLYEEWIDIGNKNDFFKMTEKNDY